MAIPKNIQHAGGQHRSPAGVRTMDSLSNAEQRERLRREHERLDAESGERYVPMFKINGEGREKRLVFQALPTLENTGFLKTREIWPTNSIKKWLVLWPFWVLPEKIAGPSATPIDR